MARIARPYHRRRNRVYRADAPLVESLEGRRLFSTYMVSNANDSGAGSLRQAILDANNHGGADTIAFAIGAGAKTIAPASRLPGLDDGTNLDATTQPGYAGKPLITIDGAHAGSADGLKIIGTGVTVRGVAVTHFSGSGIFIYGKGGNHIAGSYVGIAADGSTAAGNAAHGIIVQSPNNIIGGPNAADRNVISANGSAGVFVYTAVAKNNTIEGNYIGTDATGNLKRGNARNGVQLNGAPSNLVRGNVISGNARDGVLIVDSGSTLNVLQSNKIGTNAAGNAPLGNGWYGVEISRPGNIIGGRGAGNVISANGKSGLVLYQSTASGNVVQGNYIGTDVTGMHALGNAGRGLELTNGAHDNRIGGLKGGQGNVISGNGTGGVGIYSGSKLNLFQRNFIGLAMDGKTPLPNGGAGIIVTDGAGTNVIGAVRAGNVISANAAEGICLTGGTASTVIQANKIGTDSTGTMDLGNARDGIFAASSYNWIGGKTKGTGNIISGNSGAGVRFVGSTGNLIRLNFVGLDASGAALPNSQGGVLL